MHRDQITTLTVKQLAEMIVACSHADAEVCEIDWVNRTITVLSKEKTEVRLGKKALTYRDRIHQIQGTQ